MTKTKHCSRILSPCWSHSNYSMTTLRGLFFYCATWTHSPSTFRSISNTFLRCWVKNILINLPPVTSTWQFTGKINFPLIIGLAMFGVETGSLLSWPLSGHKFLTLLTGVVAEKACDTRFILQKRKVTMKQYADCVFFIAISKFYWQIRGIGAKLCARVTDHTSVLNPTSSWEIFRKMSPVWSAVFFILYFFIYLFLHLEQMLFN